MNIKRSIKKTFPIYKWLGAARVNSVIQHNMTRAENMMSN